jgi:hypothetical protein
MKNKIHTSVFASSSGANPLYPALCGALLLALVSYGSAVQAQSFDLALARCAQEVRFCEKESYDKDSCKALLDTIKACDTEMTAGTLCELKLDRIAPTQISVGRHVAECKANRLQARDHEGGFKDGLTRYLLRSKRHVPTVIGPKNDAGNRYYITDHHHLSYAMHVAQSKAQIDASQDRVYACVLTNRYQDKPDNFWSYMVRNHFAWLDDADAKAITTDELRNKATGISKLENYPYRSWSRWVRDSCGYVKAGNDCVPEAYPATAPYFMEFKWADYLKHNLKTHLSAAGITDVDVEDIDGLSDDDIDKVIKVAVKLAQGNQSFLQGLPGYSDGTVIPEKYVKIGEGCETAD